MGLPSFIIKVIHSFGHFVFYHVKVPVIRQLTLFIYKVLDFTFCKITFNTEIPGECNIGKNFELNHPYGIIINHAAIIGDNVRIRQQVTIGNHGNGVGGVPTIGNNVNIGCAAIILGKITVGDNSTIAANAVVTKDVPEGATVAGVPARIISQK